MIEGILAGIAAKLAGLGLAAKVGTGIAAATIATAGVVTVAPVINPGAPARVEVQIPSVPNANADLGLNVAANATGAQAGAGAQTGLDIARQTPAAAHVPASVPAVTPPAASASGGAQTGLDTARQTPAAAHVPAVVPGPPANVPAVAPPVTLPPAASAATTGIDAASQTPGGQFIPPFVKGMVGR